MSGAVAVPYVVERDEDGVWCAHAHCVQVWARMARARPLRRRSPTSLKLSRA